jgi:Xaa-Pro aminopeptidase
MSQHTMSQRKTIANGLSPIRVTERLPRLRALLSERELDCILVTALANVRYLTGFSGSAAILLISGDRRGVSGSAQLCTDGRYRTQAAEQLEAAGAAVDFETFVGQVAEQRNFIAEKVGEICGDAGGTVALEAEHVSWADQLRWAELLRPSEVVATAEVVEQLRVVKDTAEIARIEAAAQIADEALQRVVPMLEQSPTESELALALDTEMRRGGAEDRAFETIVAAGPNSAKPHHEPGSRRIGRGDTVVIDFGAVVDGYRSDMTRTFFVGGEPEPKMRDVFDAVLESQAEGVDAIAAGTSGREVDAVCRNSLARAGLADAFEHGTGHGVGLDIHEAPSIGKSSTAILPEGAVVTVEPGAYLRGLGGVRIEDTVLVTAAGCLPLTHFTKEPWL